MADELFEYLNKMDRIGMSNIYRNIKEDAIKDTERSEMYTDLILNLLLTRKSGKGRIDQLFLDKNGVESSLGYFIEKQNAMRYGLVEIISSGKNYYRFKITQDGINHFDTNSKRYNINVPTFIDRINRYVLKRILKSISFVLISANEIIKIIIKSTVIKLILIIITVLTFLVLFKIIKVA